MLKNYTGKILIWCAMVLLLLGGTAVNGWAQVVNVYPIQIEQDVFAPPAKNIAPGSTNNIIAIFAVSPQQMEGTLTSVTFTTAGTYQVEDISPNGFKLWFTNNQNFDLSSVTRATMVASKAVVASGGNLVFSGLNQTFNQMDGGYFYVTADVAPNATLGRTLHLTATPYANFVFTGATANGPGTAFPATSVQTVGTPLPVIQFYSFNTESKKFSPGSTYNRLYEFGVSFSEANAELVSATLPTTGNFTTSDIMPNGFKLYARGEHTNYDEVLVGTGSLNANKEIVFNNLDFTMQRSTHGHGSYSLMVAVDLAQGATVGSTIGIGQAGSSALGFRAAQSVQGGLSEGPLNSIAVPVITINSVGPEAGTVSPGSVRNLLYKVMVKPSNASASFSRIGFTTSGTYQASDIVNFTLYAGEEDGYESDEAIGEVAAVASGGTITFNLGNATLQEDEEVYLYLVAGLTNTAVAGRTIQIQPLTAANVTVASGTLNVTATAGGVQTIAVPAVAFTPAGPSASTISPNTYAILHTVRVDVTNAPATLMSAVYQLSGTYQPTDIGSDYDENGDGTPDGFDGIYLIYHRNPNPDDESEDVQMLNYKNTQIPASGNMLTFITPPAGSDDDDLSPTLPLGVGYISLLVEVNEDAVLGRTIQASTTGTDAFTLVSGTKTGSTGTGGVQTIGKASVAVSSVATPAANVSTGASRILLYKIKLDVTEAPAVFTGASFTTAGSYQQSDISNFELYYSTDANFNYNEDRYIAYETFVASGSTLTFDDSDDIQIRPGATGYLFVVASTYRNATAGRTINIGSVGANALSFMAAEITGNFPLPAGGVQTFVAPVITATSPGLPAKDLAAGTNLNVVHKFNVSATAADAFIGNVRVRTSGSFTQEDLSNNGLMLWYNSSDTFAGSRLLGSTGSVGNNSEIHIYGDEAQINSGTTGYFFITADIAASATAGRTLQIEVMGLHSGSAEVRLSANATSGQHTITTGVTPPSLSVTFPAVPSATLQAGSTDNLIYRFNVAAANANAFVNYVNLDIDGSFSRADLAEGGLKLWYNTTNSFAGSTLLKSFTLDHDGQDMATAIDNLRINEGSTGYFFVTASISPDAANNRTIQIGRLDQLGFMSGSATISGSRGAQFTISRALSAADELMANATQVYPNPYRQQGMLTISTDNKQPKQVTVYDVAGKIITTEAFTDTKQLSLPVLKGGLYLIKVHNLKSNQVEVKKLIVQ